MKKILIILMGYIAFAQLSFAARDVTTIPDFYYLKEAQSIDSLSLLPPPPAVDSIDFLNDKAQYDAGKLLRIRQEASKLIMMRRFMAMAYNWHFSAPSAWK